MNTKESEVDIPPVSKVCINCTNLFHHGVDRKCKAFPDGIPMDIWCGKNPHIEKHQDQENDIVFEDINSIQITSV